MVQALATSIDTTRTETLRSSSDAACLTKFTFVKVKRVSAVTGFPSPRCMASTTLKGFDASPSALPPSALILLRSFSLA